MTKTEAEKFMRYGSLAAFIAAILGSLMVVLGQMQKSDTPLPIGVILNIGVIAALGYGLRKRSRICGVLLSASLIATIVLRVFDTRSLGTSFGGFAITMFVFLGTIAAFRWHKLSERNENHGA
jgi:hypothetical protein